MAEKCGTFGANGDTIAPVAASASDPASHSAPNIVASVSAIYGIGNPSDYHQMVMTLRVGDKAGQRDVIAHLRTTRQMILATNLEVATPVSFDGETLELKAVEMIGKKS